MSLFDRFIRKQKAEKLEKQAEKGKKPAALATAKKTEKKVVKKTEGVSIGKVANKEKKEGAKGKKRFSIDASGIIIKPLITEKISSLASQGKYGFMVAPDANKITIKKAVNVIYGVEVTDVKIINVSGKSVNYGRIAGKTKDWKKAIVTLAPGEKIEVYEGV
jgi:large subunit ribosomal protein L23